MSSLWACAAEVRLLSTRTGAQPALARSRFTPWASSLVGESVRSGDDVVVPGLADVVGSLLDAGVPVSVGRGDVVGRSGEVLFGSLETAAGRSPSRPGAAGVTGRGRLGCSAEGARVTEELAPGSVVALVPVAGPVTSVVGSAGGGAASDDDGVVDSGTARRREPL
ncbi:hypothetical protein ACFS2C_25500 [Prauserella oleivorans]|uniref:Uncharacterized protein n=1 Tax=Prauserella oleivorans TaxID=1478153 RepID=A0ABW5WFP5_9PSEU